MTSTLKSEGTLPTQDQLIAAGMTAAAEGIKSKRELVKKLRIAFEHFRVVEPQHIDRFNAELQKRTFKVIGKNTWGNITEQDRLCFTQLDKYGKVPPRSVIEDILKAKNLHCFDRFEVCTIASVKVVPDPIVFGIISGCDNKYFITQWDNDISIEEILRPEEG